MTNRQHRTITLGLNNYNIKSATIFNNGYRRTDSINFRRYIGFIRLRDPLLIPSTKSGRNQCSHGRNSRSTSHSRKRRSAVEKHNNSQHNWKEDLNLSVFLLTLLSAIGGFLFGYDTGVVSGAMLQIKDDPRINPNTVWTELIVSVTVSVS